MQPPTQAVVAGFLAFVGLGVSVFLFLPSQTRQCCDETSAVKALRIIDNAESQYARQYPDRGFACSLHALGGSNGASASSQAAGFLSQDLEGGRKAGYLVYIAECTQQADKIRGYRVTGYKVVAIPVERSRPGFCSDQSGAIRYDPRGGDLCTELVQ
jgi:hypothetical protein